MMMMMMMMCRISLSVAKSHGEWPNDGEIRVSPGQLDPPPGFM